MKRVILVPVGGENAAKHFENTILKPVDFLTLKPYLPIPRYGILSKGYKRIFKTESVPVWGTTPGKNNVNMAKWNRIDAGDFVLFVRNKSIVATGSVTFKFRSPILAEKLWGKLEESGETWEYIYLLDRIENLDIPQEILNRAAGYSQDYLIRGFNVLDESKSEAIIDALKLRSLSDKLFEPSPLLQDRSVLNLTKRELKELTLLTQSSDTHLDPENVERLDELTRDKDIQDIETVLASYAAEAMSNSPEEVTQTVTIFRRNQKLVRDMKAKYQNRCQICGFTFRMANGRNYSEAAHIIPISTRREGVDSPDNIWILCANHHKMLDTGALEALSKIEYRQNGKVLELKIP